ncbi:hypothetical protein [Streptomyces lydicus]
MTFTAEPEYDPQLIADVDSAFTPADENAMHIRADIGSFIAEFIDGGDL